MGDDRHTEQYPEMVNEHTNIAANNALEREHDRLAQTLERIGATPLTYEAVARAGYDMPRLVGGISPTEHSLEHYLESGQLLTGICWCSPYVTQALTAGRDPAAPDEPLEDVNQLEAFAETYLPEARQLVDQIGGVVTGTGDPAEIILCHESELFSRKIAALTGFDPGRVRELVYRSYEEIAAVTERYIHHKNPSVTVTHCTMDEAGYETFVELMRTDEAAIFDRVQTNREAIRRRLETDPRTDADALETALNIRMEPRGPYGTAESNITVALLTATARRWLEAQGLETGPLAICNNHFYIADQNYGRRWWRDRKSMYLYELQTTPPGAGRNESVLHLGTLSMLNPFSRQPDQRQTYSRSVPRFEGHTPDSAQFAHWLTEGLVVPTTQTLNPTNATEWFERVREASTPAPTVRYLTSSPEAFAVVNFSPECIPPSIVELVQTLKTRDFTAQAKRAVATQRGVDRFEAIPKADLGAQLGAEVRAHTDELRGQVWERPPETFYADALEETANTLEALY